MMRPLQHLVANDVDLVHPEHPPADPKPLFSATRDRAPRWITFRAANGFLSERRAQVTFSATFAAERVVGVRSRAHTPRADLRHVWKSTWPRPAGHVRCGLRQSARRRPSRLEVLVLPRRACSRCRRSIAVKQDGTIRSHFCPHYRSCEPGYCVDCDAPSIADWPQVVQLMEPPLNGATPLAGDEPRS